MQVFRRQLEEGSLQKAYRALLSYIMDLRTHFMKGYPDYVVSGLYQGSMDMTYFALVPPSLEPHGLKIAIVFNYAAFRFEAWLVGRNRKVQRQYWELFRSGQWPGYRVVRPAVGVDSIVERDLASDFDFSNSDALTSSIETATIAFIDEMERFLSEHRFRG
jgi:hypothetical protein